MRILIVHNQLWAHYKSKLFEDISYNLTQRYPDAVLTVGQIALYESGRRDMQDTQERFRYPYQLLFEKSLEQVGFLERMISLFKLFSDFKPDVLNITGYYDVAQLLLMIYARVRGVRVVLSSESSVQDHSRNRLKEWFKARIINLADAFFCFGSSSVGYLSSLGVPSTRIAVRHAAVIDDRRVLAHYQSAANDATGSSANFIFVGRIAKEKNLLTLLRAYKEVRKKAAFPWGLYLVGDGPYRSELEDYIRLEGIEGVVFTGGLPWLEVPEWLAKARVLVLPSYSEPWGLVVNEALVCGLPVIVSEKCGCVDDLVIPGQTGALFDPDDTDALVLQMHYFMHLPESDLRAYGQRGQAIVRKFASQKVAHEMVDTYVSLTRGTPSK